MRFFLVLALCLFGCGQKAPSAPEPIDTTLSVDEAFTKAVQRFDMLDDDGWVVSRDADGSAEDQGDSLIFTGIAMHALPCDHATPLLEAFPDGKLFRHPSIRNDVSLDGALGYYFGVASKVVRCNQAADWKGPFGRVLELADTDSTVPKEFTFIRDALGFRLGLRSEPSLDRRNILEAQIAAWAQATMASHSACFRVHLGWLALRTLEMLDMGPSDMGKIAFCEASKGSGLPVIENWCGRENLIHWLDNFQSNQWAYRHQRCDGWEQPDGNGREQPGVDYLLGFREAYNIK